MGEDSSGFRCVLADPPWRFDDRGSRIAPDHRGRHYDTMPLDQVVGLGAPIRAVTARDAHLWLWAPNAFVLSGDAQLVVRLWGFTPRQLITWGKLTRNGRPHIGMGHWLRNTTEQLIFATRGSLPSLSKSRPTMILAERQRHSRKPPEAHDLIESVSPGPRIELFARTQRDGWTAVGHEIDGADAVTALCRLAIEANCT